MLGCFFQAIPAMNPATVAGIGPLLGPFWPDSHQTEDDRAHIEDKLSIRQVERTVEKDSVIQNFRITAPETKHLGERDGKARSPRIIRKPQMVPVIKWHRITQPPKNKAFFRHGGRAGLLDCWEATAQVTGQVTEQVPATSLRRYRIPPARLKRLKEL